MRRQVTNDAARNTKCAWVAGCEQMFCKDNADTRVLENSLYLRIMSDGIHFSEVSFPEWLRGWTQDPLEATPRGFESRS